MFNTNQLKKNIAPYVSNQGGRFKLGKRSRSIICNSPLTTFEMGNGLWGN